MKSMILSAYWARKTAEELFDKSPEINYHNIIPGYITSAMTQDGEGVKKSLIPVWRVFISKKALKKALAKQDAEDCFCFIDLFGKELKVASDTTFTQIEIGTIFRYPDGTSVMLESCDHQHHKVFVSEPRISIGIKKGNILYVCE